MTKWKRLLLAVRCTIRQLAALVLVGIVAVLTVWAVFSSLTAFCLVITIIALIVWVRQNYMSCVRDEAWEEYQERQKEIRETLVDACTASMRPTHRVTDDK